MAGDRDRQRDKGLMFRCMEMHKVTYRTPTRSAQELRGTAGLGCPLLCWLLILSKSSMLKFLQLLIQSCPKVLTSSPPHLSLLKALPESFVSTRSPPTHFESSPSSGLSAVGLPAGTSSLIVPNQTEYFPCPPLVTIPLTPTPAFTGLVDDTASVWILS